MSTAQLNAYPPSFIPHEWLWSNYSKALETFEYWTYFKNTFEIIIPAVGFGTITAIFCGYAFARLRFRGKQLFFVTVQNPLGELINFCTKQRIFKTCFAILFR